MYFKNLPRGAWLAQVEEQITLDLGVMSLSLTLGVGIMKKIKIKINPSTISPTK